MTLRRDGRVDEGTGLENQRGASFRGFESHSLRNDQAPDRMNASKATPTDRMVAL